MRKSKKIGLKTKACFLLACAFAAALIIYNSSTQILIQKGVSDFEASMSSAVYNALGSELLRETDFSDYFKITYADDGTVALITTDSMRINMLSHSLAVNAFNFYSDYCSRGVSVPIGAFSGIRMLSGTGRTVNIKLISVVSVKCEFLSKFEEAGINQTRQSLYLLVTPDVTVIAGRKKVAKTASVSVLVYDNLIVGKVPSTYLEAQIVGSSG